MTAHGFWLRRYALALVLVFWAMSASAVDEVAPTPLQPCVHELQYEPFAGLILVSLTINDSPPLDFVLDSGATQSSITDPFLAAALGLEVREAGLARGMGSGATRVLIAEDACLRADGEEILCTPLVVHDIGVRLSAMAGRELHGFLGADLFERWVVEIDPANRRLLLHDPESYVDPPQGEHLHLEVVDRRPIVDAEVVTEVGKKPLDVRLVVDTGSSRYLTLITRSRRRLKPPVEQTLGASVGVVGDTLVPIAPVAQLTVGTRVVSNLETAWMEPYQIPAIRNIPNLNGILGNALLGRFHTVLDYHHGRLIVGPLFGYPDVVNEIPD
ncbi:MAG: aspartyl protease family protein [Acidobacteriota bacterium]|nr:aspartyl protease family protein [Acidobacteriota bacterium]